MKTAAQIRAEIKDVEAAAKVTTQILKARWDHLVCSCFTVRQDRWDTVTAAAGKADCEKLQAALGYGAVIWWPHQNTWAWVNTDVRPITAEEIAAAAQALPSDDDIELVPLEQLRVG